MTLRLRPDVALLRRRAIFSTVRRALVAGSLRPEFRVVHFSVQSNHIHLICEAAGARTLACGIQGLAVRLARGVNRRLARTGSVFAERYHARAIKTPRHARNTLVYVLRNLEHHRRGEVSFDPCSSAGWFDGWAEPVPIDTTPSPLPPPATWLLREGWRLHGLLRLDETPSRRP